MVAGLSKMRIMFVNARGSRYVISKCFNAGRSGVIDSK